MLSRDPIENDEKYVPLFRNIQTNKEITYEHSSRRLKEVFTQAGFPELASGVHCLQIGGATAYANSPEGGDLIAGFMGLWLSDSKYSYMHACVGRLHRASLSVGREKGDDIAMRPGPVNAYAPRR